MAFSKKTSIAFRLYSIKSILCCHDFVSGGVVKHRVAPIEYAFMSGPAPFNPLCLGAEATTLVGCFDTHPRGNPSSDTSLHPATIAFTVYAKVADAVAFVTTREPGPTAAFAGTVVVIELALLVVMFAVAPPIFTEAPANPEPLTVTGVPADAEVGVTDVMAGAGGDRTVKAKVAVGKVPTVTTPPPTEAAVAFLGTLVVMTVPVLLVIVAGSPPIVTVAPLRDAPVITITVSAVPLVGVAVVIEGCAAGGGLITAKAIEAGASPGTLTTTPPPEAAVAPAGTLVVMTVPVLPVTPAARPPMVTVAPDILAPLMTISVPG